MKCRPSGPAAARPHQAQPARRRGSSAGGGVSFAAAQNWTVGGIQTHRQLEYAAALVPSATARLKRLDIVFGRVYAPLRTSTQSAVSIPAVPAGWLRWDQGPSARGRIGAPAQVLCCRARACSANCAPADFITPELGQIEQADQPSLPLRLNMSPAPRRKRRLGPFLIWPLAERTIGEIPRGDPTDPRNVRRDLDPSGIDGTDDRRTILARRRGDLKCCIGAIDSGPQGPIYQVSMPANRIQIHPDEPFTNTVTARFQALKLQAARITIQ